MDPEQAEVLGGHQQASVVTVPAEPTSTAANSSPPVHSRDFIHNRALTTAAAHSR